MTHNEMIKKCMRTEHGMFRPLYTHKKEVPIYDSEKNIIDWELVDYKEIKTAQDVYDEWLTNKDKPPIIEEDKITILKEEVDRLTIENDSLKARVNATENAVIDLMLTGYKA